jgi:hypothetical protein
MWFKTLLLSMITQILEFTVANVFHSRGGSFVGEVDLSSIPKARTARELYIHALQEMANTPSVLPLSTYKEILRFLMAKFSTFSVLDSQDKLFPVKCTHARPERAIAKMNQTTNIILPTCTVAQTGVRESDDRRKIRSILLHDKIWNDEKQRAERVLRFADRPATLLYTVNVWTKYLAHMDLMSEQIRILFNPTLGITTSLEQGTPAFLDSETDNSTVVLGDREDRIIRKGFNIRVETYIKSPRFKVTSTGEIITLNSDTGIIS